MIVEERTAHIAAAAVVAAMKDDSYSGRYSCDEMEDNVPPSHAMVGVVEDLHKTKGVNDLLLPVGTPKDRHEDAHVHDEQEVPYNEEAQGRSVGADHRYTIPKPPPLR